MQVGIFRSNLKRLLKTVGRLAVILAVILQIFTWTDSNAFDVNINDCLFNGWKSGGNAVLSAKVDCRGHERTGLCYGKKQPALFAVCYNKNTLIPEFSGNIVRPACERVAGKNAWRNERGRYAPNPQSEYENDYDPYKQKSLVPNFDENQGRFYSRGHLTPKADFANDEDQQLTMVNTNIAPQWQLFNGINWATLEEAVRKYSDKSCRVVYVFTGTGGNLIRSQAPMKVNNRVVIPKYFWKAVCDPVKKTSVFFIAENPTGAEDENKQEGCNGVKQTPNKGIIHCYSLDSAKTKLEASLFKLPAFSDICKPSERGTFLDPYLEARLQ